MELGVVLSQGPSRACQLWASGSCVVNCIVRQILWRNREQRPVVFHLHGLLWRRRLCFGIGCHGVWLQAAVLVAALGAQVSQDLVGNE